ncbi:MAG: ABC transporter permease [Chloroflexi bacterium]|nr:ABC transporter permease [Chloroflexota bacterium]
MFRIGINKLALIRKFPVNPGIPLLIVLLCIVMAIFAPYIAPESPTKQSLPNQFQEPGYVDKDGTKHYLGTDKFGRDNLSRIIYGARISLVVAVLTIIIAAFIGTLLGLVAGYYGGWVDSLLMRITDVGLALPLILVALVLAVVYGAELIADLIPINVVLVIGLLLWPRFARQIRGETLAIKEQDYIALARVAGCSPMRIMIKHIFPNVIPTLLVLCTLNVGYVILLEASLSFLGVGVPPETPTWGLMVSDGKGVIATYWWISLFPGLAIMFLVLSLNFFGDWVRDKLDPKLRQV